MTSRASSPFPKKKPKLLELTTRAMKRRSARWKNSRKRLSKRFWQSMEKTSSRNLKTKYWKNSYLASFWLQMRMTSLSNTTILINVSMNTSLKLRNTKKSPSLSQKRTQSGKKWIVFRKIRRREFKVYRASKTYQLSKPNFFRNILLRPKRSLTSYL